nr:MAG TPA: hypothetical protein [Caudoviricetes sp.]
MRRFFYFQIFSLFLNKQFLRITFNFFITKFILSARTFTKLYKIS